MGVICHFMALVTEAQKGPADILKTHCLLHLIACTQWPCFPAGGLLAHSFLWD